MVYAKSIPFDRDLSKFKVNDLLDDRNKDRRETVLEALEEGGIFNDYGNNLKFKYKYDVTNDLDFVIKITPMTQKEKREEAIL